MYKTILVEDHEVVRSGLKLLLDHTPDFTIVGEACCARDALEMSRAKDWDLIVTDYSLKESNAFTILDYWQDKKTRPPILVFSVHEEKDLIIRLYRSGARGFVHKKVEAENFIGAARKVAQGDRYVDPEVATMLLDAQNGQANPMELLTDREYQILMLIVEGLRTNEISKRLHITASTVSTHKEKIREKFGLPTDGKVIRYVLNNS